MKQRTYVLVLLAVAMIPAAALAYTGGGGGRGLFRVQSAMVEEAAGLTVGFHALARRDSFTAVEPQNSWGGVADLIAPELSYAPVATKYVGLELFGSWGGLFQYPKSDSQGGLGTGLHDLKAGAKLSIPVLPVLKLGAMGNYTFKTRDTMREWLDPSALPVANNPAYTWRVLGDLHLQDLLPSLPSLLFNYGKVNGGTEYGAGVELAGKGFGLFVEAQSQQPAGSNDPFNTTLGQIHLTPGVVLGTSSGFALKAAYTFGFGLDGVDEALLGLTIATGFGKRAPAEYGQLAGTVVDARTSAPIAANVSFPDNSRLSAMTAGANGVFRLDKVPTGVVTVEVTAEGYQGQAMPIAIEPNQLSQYEFRLRPLKVYSTIAGVVTDAATGMPLAAMVEFPNTPLATITSDAGSGAFRVDNVEPGIYTITATADGYLKGTIAVTVAEDKPATPTIALNPVPKEAMMAFTGKVSDKKTGEGIAATVSFPGSLFGSVTTDPATGVYQTRLAAGPYAVKVDAEGYFAQTAAIVIEKEKPLVRDFGLVKEGMTITLKGVYFDFGKATLRPESRATLADAARILTENPTIRVEIEGHTDSIGSDASNLTLSDKRAWSVVEYLVQNHGISRDRLTARGYGKARPIATNDTDEGRALNRRVEFVIVGQMDK